MKRIILKSGEEDRILRGHPWVYDNEVAEILGAGGSAELEPGELAEVECVARGRPRYLGRAFVNPHSKIIARIFSPSKEGVDKGFFKSRIRRAILRRTTYDLYREPARIVFAEADFLPGFIADRFVGWPLAEIETQLSDRPVTFEAVEKILGKPKSWLSVQFLIYAVDMRREEILSALEETLSAPLGPGETGLLEPLGAPGGIIEKSAAKVREAEGLPPREGLLRGTFPPEGIVIFENGFPFVVHPEEGQKTGHFLDQKDNRRLIAPYASGSRVLDGCSYTGGFSIHAARYGALEVTAVDSSDFALEALKKNAALNGVSDRINTIKGDIFDLLPALEKAKEKYDLVILDPPAFAKTRSALEKALAGYREINRRAIALLNPGGVLVTCSCSHALDEARFRFMITEAAADAERRLALLDFRSQAQDHPVLVGYDESQYLKCGFYRAL
ncbi:SAM-dependent methyltransferase [Spirochaetia bacterium]|nr:SAM-dependent methyltransferase [Spirochaetia bacterium]